MKRLNIIVYFIATALIVVFWAYAAENSNNVKVLISSPRLILNYFSSNTATLMSSFYVTFIESFGGLLIATAFSFMMMILCFYFVRVMDFVLPVMIFSQVVPLITLAPLFIILFGDGITAKLMMSALLSFFPIFINMANGVKLINTNIHELLFIYNASTGKRIRHVYFPLILPNIMAGLKIAATLAVIGATVAEFNGAEKGLGKNLFLSAKRLEPELMMCSLFLAALLGGLMYYVVYLFEARLGKWYLKTFKP